MCIDESIYNNQNTRTINNNDNINNKLQLWYCIIINERNKLIRVEMTLNILRNNLYYILMAKDCFLDSYDIFMVYYSINIYKSNLCYYNLNPISKFKQSNNTIITIILWDLYGTLLIIPLLVTSLLLVYSWYGRWTSQTRNFKCL